MDWAHESTYRFFPVERDERFGWRLHWIDTVTNKALAAASRTEARDMVDLMQVHGRPLSLGAIVWAASGKDPGLSPEFMLDQIVRHGRPTPEDLALLEADRPIDGAALRQRFRAASEEARELFVSMPPHEAGVVYLDPAGQAIEPDPGNPETMRHPHSPSVRGTWPTVVEDEPDWAGPGHR